MLQIQALWYVFLLAVNLTTPLDIVNPAIYLRGEGVTITIPELEKHIADHSSDPAIRHMALSYLVQAEYRGLPELVNGIIDTEPDPVFKQALAAAAGKEHAIKHSIAELCAPLPAGAEIIVTRKGAGIPMPLLSGAQALEQIKPPFTYDQFIRAGTAASVGRMLAVKYNDGFIIAASGVFNREILENLLEEMKTSERTKAFFSQNSVVLRFPEDTRLVLAVSPTDGNAAKLAADYTTALRTQSGAIADEENFAILFEDATAEAAFALAGGLQEIIPDDGAPQSASIVLNTLTTLQGRIALTFATPEHAEAIKATAEGILGSLSENTHQGMPPSIQLWLRGINVSTSRNTLHISLPAMDGLEDILKHLQMDDF